MNETFWPAVAAEPANSYSSSWRHLSLVGRPGSLQLRREPVGTAESGDVIAGQAVPRYVSESAPQRCDTQRTVLVDVDGHRTLAPASVHQHGLLR